MNTQANAVPESPTDAQVIAPRALSATRPMYWSVRRELWENRSIYLAPLLVAGVVLVGFLFGAIRLPGRLLTLGPDEQRAVIEKPYDIVAMLLILNGFLVGVFYCLDALHGERRDRSILFWKSLPVSDLTTVLSKASIPLVVQPLLTFAITVATQIAMLVVSLGVPLTSGIETATPQWSLLEKSLVLLYGLVALSLWHAPIYGWLLLVSGWAPRATFLWAVLPLLAVAVLEKIAFNSTHFVSLLKHRFIGHLTGAFAMSPDGSFRSVTQITPGSFLSMPGLWIGLVFAAAFLGAAARLRRSRGPL